MTPLGQDAVRGASVLSIDDPALGSGEGGVTAARTKRLVRRLGRPRGTGIVPQHGRKAMGDVERLSRTIVTET